MKIRVWICQSDRQEDQDHPRSSSPFGLVWNAKDVIRLRREHRIVGNLIGCPPKTPHQQVDCGLPLVVSAEEISILTNEEVIQTVFFSNKKSSQSNTREIKRRFVQFREESYADQIVAAREERKREIIFMADKIVEGKKRKLSQAKARKQEWKKVRGQDTTSSQTTKGTDAQTDEQEPVIDREKVIQEEIDKIRDFPLQNVLIQIFNEDPFGLEDNIEGLEWRRIYPRSASEELRFLTFQELRKRGFYVTKGDKFGADFLAYPGDPLVFHAKFVVLCLKITSDQLKQEEESTLVARCRLGTAVNKTVLISTVSDCGSKVIKFTKLQWTAADNNSAAALPPAQQPLNNATCGATNSE